jgi:DNA-binding IclR family transcriptional regulator
LDQTRERGYASNFEESEPGIAAFAVSVGRIDGQHSALSVAMPIARFTEEFGETMVENLRAIRTRVISIVNQ